MTRSLLFLPLALAALLAGASSSRAQQPDAPLSARFYFPVGFLCGTSSEEFQEGVVAGGYRTAIKILNPSASETARIAKTVTRALPYQATESRTEFIEDEIPPSAAITIECDEIRQRIPSSMAEQFRSGYVVIFSDREIDVSVGYTARPSAGEISALDSETVTARETCPLRLGDPGRHLYADKVCLGFSWNCANPQSLTVALAGQTKGTLNLDRTEDYLLADGSSTFCASTTDLPDGTHTLAATLACEVQQCTVSTPVDIANTPFRLITVEPDRKRYRAADTVRVRLVLSENVDSVTADFSRLDTAFDDPDNAGNLSVVQSGPPGTYEIEYAIDGIDNANGPGIYPVPLTFRQGTVTRRFNGLRLGYVGETDNLLRPVDGIPTTTVIGRLPAEDTSSVSIGTLQASETLILPLTSVGISGTIEAPFIEGRPRALVEQEARNYTLLWRERDLNTAGAYMMRPASLTFECDPDGEQICHSGRFEVELGFPVGTNALAAEGPHRRTLRFVIVDPEGGVSNGAETEVTLAVLNQQMYGGTIQSADGGAGAGSIGDGVDFRLHQGIPHEGDENPLTLVLTWNGESGPGATQIPGQDDLPATLDALDLNIGLHRAPADGHGGWFGNTGNATLLRKSNTCFSGTGLDQPSPDRFNCVCGDASDLNMEVMAYAPGVPLDEGGDGEGTFGAEYYIYDSCGSQQDTVATLTAYYCGIVEQQSFAIDAHLSEENEDLEQNWNNGCLFGSPCHDPKTVPTGFNETGGFYEGFDFNPTDCSGRPSVAGRIGYMAPINFALNDPSMAGDLFNEDPAQDQSWSFFDENLNATGWTRFDAPFVRVVVRLADGTQEEIDSTFTNEDGEFSILLPPDYAANGETGRVTIEAVAESPPTFGFRVIQDLDAENVHRIVLVEDLDPVANAGEPLDLLVNDGPDDEDAKEGAAALHILRNTMLAAQYLLSLGRLVEPFTALYDRDTVLLTADCKPDGSFYSGSERYAHFQSAGPNIVRKICPAGQADADGNCTVACIDDPSGAVYAESRVDFTYNTHMHEFFHHVTSSLTTIGPNSVGQTRAVGSHYGNTSERTSLNEGIATAFGGVLASRFIYQMFGPGQPMNPTLIECTKDDLTNCDLSITESIDWLTLRNKDDDTLIRPGPDWQPQNDCPPGALGCGCGLGSCSAAGNVCQGGYCVDPSDACTPDTQGCAVSAGCPVDQNLVDNGGFCVLPVSYSDGWTWRVLWDLLDEGEDVQPETSHWRTSQMSNADPAVADPYDTFGGVDAFWRTLMRHVGEESETPVPVDDFHPNLADLLDRWRCDVGEEAFAPINDYLVDVVEFPYHNPAAPCP